MGNFDTVVNRFNTKSVKWDMLDELYQSKDCLPMWVADMDFKAPKEVNDALKEKADHGIYGYTIADTKLKNAIINWNQSRNNWTIKPEWITFSNGVVTSLHMAVQAFTKPKDKVLIQTPVYPPFYNVIEAHDRELVKNELQYEDDSYKINFEDFEAKLKSGVKAFILCSPHNPVGRLWKKEELEEIARLCIKYDVVIISDEIHGDLALPGQNYIPIASLSEKIANQTVTCTAASKTFNLAGLDASYVVTSDEEKRKALETAFEKQGFHNMLNTMGNIATEAAYTHGAEWLDELKELLQSHYEFVKETFEKHAPEIKVIKPEATYLLWLDCSALGLDPKELNDFFVKEAQVGLNAGLDYGEEAGQFMRMNIGCPRETLEEAVNRIVRAVYYIRK
ncbi:MalY/PatB family protein [Oceanobacillus sp. CAU 1775]